MSTFNYIAVDGSGKETRGTIKAESPEKATDMLKRQGVFPTSLSGKQAEALRYLLSHS